jgi:hypothetical protein
MVPKEKDAQIYPMEKGSRELAGELRAYLSTRARDASYACNECCCRSGIFPIAFVRLVLRKNGLHVLLNPPPIVFNSRGQ